jgi:hypothetical protein
MVAMMNQYVLNREMLNLELVSHAQSSLLATTSTPASSSRVGGATIGDHRDLRDGCIIQNLVSCVIGVLESLAQLSNVFHGKAAISRSIFKPCKVSVPLAHRAPSHFVPVLNTSGRCLVHGEWTFLDKQVISCSFSPLCTCKPANANCPYLPLFGLIFYLQFNRQRTYSTATFDPHYLESAELCSPCLATRLHVLKGFLAALSWYCADDVFGHNSCGDSAKFRLVLAVCQIRLSPMPSLTISRCFLVNCGVLSAHGSDVVTQRNCHLTTFRDIGLDVVMFAQPHSALVAVGSENAFSRPAGGDQHSAAEVSFCCAGMCMVGCGDRKLSARGLALGFPAVPGPASPSRKSVVLCFPYSTCDVFVDAWAEIIRQYPSSSLLCNLQRSCLDTSGLSQLGAPVTGWYPAPASVARRLVSGYV